MQDSDASARKAEAARKREEDIAAGTVQMNGRELFAHEPWVFDNTRYWVAPAKNYMIQLYNFDFSDSFHDVDFLSCFAFLFSYAAFFLFPFFWEYTSYRALLGTVVCIYSQVLMKNLMPEKHCIQSSIPEANGRITNRRSCGMLPCKRYILFLSIPVKDL